MLRRVRHGAALGGDAFGRGDVDDPPSPLALRSSRQARTRRWCGVSRTSRALIHSSSKLGSSSATHGEACIVDHDVDRPEFGPDLLDRGDDRVGVGDVEHDAARRAAGVRMRSTTASTRSRLRSVTATLAPSSANRKAVARPMPDAAPVMTTTLSATERLRVVMRLVMRPPRRRWSVGTRDDAGRARRGARPGLVPRQVGCVGDMLGFEGERSERRGCGHRPLYQAETPV